MDYSIGLLMPCTRCACDGGIEDALEIPMEGVDDLVDSTDVGIKGVGCPL